ncbi:hypothetical protein [Micromonospora sp. C95]|uniref:hypothetical protein n=1 Tax=Micromonospora sp. C95 TaxID=2824882 RepID=UPI002657472A|nr:hypothetical protein [Micromonospora sp. C95]
MAEYVDAMTSPIRSVELPAMLIAVEAFDPCEVPLAADDPRVLELVASVGDRFGGVSTLRSGGGLTVEFDQTGQVVRARATREVSYDEAMAGLARIGLRTTTADEWEWACGAGAAASPDPAHIAPAHPRSPEASTTSATCRDHRKHDDLRLPDIKCQLACTRSTV